MPTSNASEPLTTSDNHATLPVEEQTFPTRLTVLERRGDKCLCRCLCGREVLLRWQSVRRGETKSCGCLRAEMLKSRTIKPLEIGAVFGRLTILSYDGKTSLCRCACGQKVRVASTKLRTGKTQSCGCYQREQAGKAAIKVESPGTVYGYLTVLEQVGRFCRCRCACGSELQVETNKLRFGHVKSCGCLRVEQAIKMAADKMLPSGEVAFNSVYAQYSIQAKLRQLSFELTPDQFRSITTRNCVYCGAVPAQIKRNPASIGTYVYNGVDRADNSRGYTLENSVPACGMCNYAKGSLSADAFWRWAGLVASRPTVLLCEHEVTDTAAHRLLYRRYQNTAKRKKHAWNLNLKEFTRLTSSACAYCGQLPYRELCYGKHRILYTGIDRKANGLGYETDNVVPCCWNCNNAKSIGPASDFIAWALRVVNFKYANEQCQ